MLGIYCRISKEKEQGKGQSLDNQKQLGIELATKLKLDYKVYTDDGLSGASDKIEDRPQFEKFLGDVSNGTLTQVFAYDQSRFERNPQIRFVINNLFKKHKVIYYTYMDGEVDLHDPQSEFFGDLLSVINKYHVTTTKIKVKSALINRALLGKGQAVMPYGYTKDKEGYIIIDKEEAEIVKRIFDMSLRAIGTKTIAETLNDEGVPTRYNKLNRGYLRTKNKYTGEVTTTAKKDVKWSGNSIRGIIVNPISKGEKRFKDELVKVPAIFSVEYWDRVNENLPKNMNNKTSSKNVYAYLLKGLLRCGVCGRNMYGRKRADKHDNHYSCSSKRIKNENCGNRSINIDKLDEFIWNKLFMKSGFMNHLSKQLKALNDTNKINESIARVDTLNKKISVLKTKNDDAIQMVLDGIVSKDDIGNVLNKNKAQITKCESEIEALNNSIKLGNNTKQVLNSFPDFSAIKGNPNFDVKIKVFNDIIKNIIVKYDEATKEYLIDIEYRVNITNEKYKSDMIPVKLTWDNYLQVHGKPTSINLPIILPQQVLSNECSIGRRGQLPAAGRNIYGAQWRTFFG